MKTYSEKVAEAEAKVDKLPKYGQELVEYWKRRAQRAEGELAEIKQGPDDSNVYRVWGMRDQDQALGRDCSIRFQLGGVTFKSLTVRPGKDSAGEFLYVIGDSRLAIEPGGTNNFRVRLND